MNLIIDGSSLLHRVYHMNKQRNASSVQSDMYAFLNSLKSYVKMFRSKSIYVCWDKKILREDNFRHTQTNGTYKGNRDKETAREVYECSEELEKILTTLGCKNMFPYTLEADDVISWLCDKIDDTIVIVSTDGDMLQLISDRISVYNPRKKQHINNSNFKEIVGVNKSAYITYKAILGDSADNIKGLEGYGKVKSKILAEAMTGSSFQKNTLNEQQLNIIEANIKLVDLKHGYKHVGEQEIKCYDEQYVNSLTISADLDQFKLYCQQYKFSRFLTNFKEWEMYFRYSNLLNTLNNLV